MNPNSLLRTFPPMVSLPIFQKFMISDDFNISDRRAELLEQKTKEKIVLTLQYNKWTN